MRDFLKNHPVAVGLAFIMHVLLFGFLVVKFDADRDLSGGHIAAPIQSELIIDNSQQQELIAQAKLQEDQRAQEILEEKQQAELEREQQREQRELETARLEQEIKDQEAKIEEQKRQDEIKKQQEVEERKIEQARKEQELEDQKRVEAEAQEKERLEKIEQDRLKIEQAEKAEQAEKDRIEKEQLEKEQAAEAEKKRLAEESERIAAEQAAVLAAAEADMAAAMAQEEEQLNIKRLASLRSGYVFAIKQRIRSKWYPQDGLTGQRCRLEVIQAPNGTVLDVKSSTTATCIEQMRDSVEKAVYRADPLPAAPSREVFDRSIVITFCTPDIQEDAC